MNNSQRIENRKRSTQKILTSLMIVDAFVQVEARLEDFEYLIRNLDIVTYLVVDDASRLDETETLN